MVSTGVGGRSARSRGLRAVKAATGAAGKTATRRKRRLASADRRRELLRVAAALLTTRGVDGVQFAEIAAAADSELAIFAASGPDDAEMERCVAQAEAHFVYRLQTVGGFGGKSDQLNAYNVMRGDPGFFTQDLDRYRKATPASVQDAARRFLRPDRRVVLSVVPRGQAADALPGSEPVAVS